MCGIAGAYGVKNAAYIVSLMLQQLQHRGQEAAGVVASDGKTLRQYRGFGLVGEVFNGMAFHEVLPGSAAIGHVRYSTSSGCKDLKSIQPFLYQDRFGQTAIAHNGNLTNYKELRARLEQEGAVFQSESDTGIFPHLLARSKHEKEIDRITDAVAQTEGASSLLILNKRSMHGIVDPWGFRPLFIAPYKKGHVFASETCALDLLGVQGKSIEPGEIVSPHKDVMRSRRYCLNKTLRCCSFCYIYFSKPETIAFGDCVTEVRHKLGSLLAKRHPVKTDIIVPVPDSANVIALSYARNLGIPFEFGLIRNHYTGRTFITPKQKAREFGVRMKLNVVRSLVRNKTVTVVDDSLVRGTTMKKVANLLRNAGAKEVHVRIGSPPVIHPCFWGIDTPKSKDLIAVSMKPNQLARELEVDSLAYLAIEDLLNALEDPTQQKHCITCFNGKHPTEGLEKPTYL